MAKKKILFISQEIMPYLPESEMAHIGRYLPQRFRKRQRNQDIHAALWMY